MILEKETYDRFGYYPKDLKPQSNKKILATCDGCGKVRMTSKNAYRELCHYCSLNTKEVKQKMSDAGRGKSLSEEHKRKIGDGNRGKHLTEEHKRKISEMRIKNRVASGERNNFYGIKKIGQSNPNWKGGLSYGQYCSKFSIEFKERVREYFGRCCYLCGKNEIDNERKLDIHHVTYNKDTCCDNTKPLFVPLCKNCHAKTNGDRESWEEFFTISLAYLTNGKSFYTKEEWEEIKK